MGKFLTIVNGRPQMQEVPSGDATTIYDESLLVVSGTPGAGEIQGPITTGTSITLPSSQTYEDDELEVYFNGQRIESVYDYNYVGTIPRTQISMTFDLEIGDIIRFRIDRGA